MWCLREEIARTAVWCPLMGSVRLREVSVSGGLTVHFVAIPTSWREMEILKVWGQRTRNFGRGGGVGRSIYFSDVLPLIQSQLSI